MSDAPAQAGALSPVKRELLALLLKKRGLAPPERHARRDRAGPCQLSYAQERIWVFEQLEPGTAAYNVAVVVRLTGRLDVSALERTFSEIIRRHETLRTVFETVDGRPVQVITGARPNPLPIIDLSQVRDADREAHASRLAQEESRRPFDLRQGPLLRTSLLRLDEQDFIALITMHHIVSDGWSMGVLIREVSLLYDAYSRAAPSPLPELTTQYADFAHWQRQWLRGEVLDEQLDYWKRSLAGAPATVRLATDGPRREAQSFEAGYISRSVPGTLLEALKALGKREDATLFMVLLAAFKTLLYRYTWQEDIVVGTPIANRNRTETEPLIGFFVNTLVLRSDLSANPTFRELIGRIRVATLGAYAHQDLPFDMLVDALSAGRDPGHNPLFQIFFALNNNPAPVLELDGLRLRQLPITNGFSKFDLEVSLVEKGPELMANIIYKTELFKARSIDRMLEHYSVILDEVARNPELRLMEIPLEDERAGCADDETAFDTDQFAFEL